MPALADAKQEAFAHAYLEFGFNATAAYRHVFKAKKGPNLKSQASRYATNDHLWQRIQELNTQRIDAGAQTFELAREYARQGVMRLGEIVNSPDAYDGDVIRATDLLLDRAYGKAPQSVNINQTVRYVIEAPRTADSFAEWAGQQIEAVPLALSAVIVEQNDEAANLDRIPAQGPGRGHAANSGTDRNTGK